MERNGKWTTEEEEYTAKLIELFVAGQVGSEVQDGDTLRAFLSIKLSCKPMRVSKKFAHQQILGLQYQSNANINECEILDRQMLDELRESYLLKDAIVKENRRKRKKYLKGSAIQKVMKPNEYEESRDEDNDELKNLMMTIDWDDMNFDDDTEGDK